MSDDAPWLVVGLGNPGKEFARNRHNAGFLVADLLASRVGARFGRSKRAQTEVAEGRLGFGGPKLVLAKPLTYMNLSGAPVAALAQFFKVPVSQVIAVHDELDVPFGEVRAKFGRAKRTSAEMAEGRLGFGGPKLVLVKPLTFMNLSGGPVVSLAQFFKVPVTNVIAVHDELDVPFGQVRAKRGGGEGGHNGLRSMSKSLASKEYARVRVGIGRPPGRQDPADYVLSDFAGVERKELDFVVDRAADVVEAIVLEGVEWAQNKYHGG